MEWGLSGGGGGGRSRSVGGMGRGLSLWRVPGAAWEAEECKKHGLTKGSPATEHRKVGGGWQEGEVCFCFICFFVLFLREIISADVE